MKARTSRTTLWLAGLLVAAGCEFGQGPGGPGGRGREQRLASLTHLKSSVLTPLPKTAAGAAATAAPEGDERCDYGRPCLTPLNLEGRIREGNLMVGGNGGPPGTPVRVVEGYDTSYHGEATGRGGNLKFNLGTSTELSGGYACCSDGYPPDELALVHRLEFLFDYLDATFKVPSGAGTAIAGRTYTIRLVYVDTGFVDDLPLGPGKVHLGDKLLRREGEDTFSWCTESGCVAATRPEQPLRTAWHADTRNIAYPHYYTVGISLKAPMSFTQAEAEEGSWKFTVDWDLTRAAVFHTGDWAQIGSEAELVDAFDLLSGFGGPGGIGVRVDMAKTALPRDTLGTGPHPQGP